jgi:hypothetical protein
MATETSQAQISATATTVSILVENRLNKGSQPNRTIHLPVDGTTRKFAEALKLEDPSFSGSLLATHIMLNTWGYTIGIQRKPGTKPAVDLGSEGSPLQVNELDPSKAIDIAIWTVIAKAKV